MFVKINSTTILNTDHIVRIRTFEKTDYKPFYVSVDLAHDVIGPGVALYFAGRDAAKLLASVPVYETVLTPEEEDEHNAHDEHSGRKEDRGEGKETK